MSDLISRQAVTKFLNDWLSCLFEICHKQSASDLKMIIKDFKNLPSAQPETNCSEIPNGSDDTISRRAAIDALARMMPRSYTPDGSHPADEEIFRAQEVIADCIEALEILPSAQPEIIRCKDCKFSHMTNDGRYCKYCDQFTDDYGELVEMYFDSNFYCGYAERRKHER